jgi:hypothetical protein
MPGAIRRSGKERISRGYVQSGKFFEEITVALGNLNSSKFQEGEKKEGIYT